MSRCKRGKHEWSGMSCLVAHFDVWGRMLPGCPRCKICGYVPWPEYCWWGTRAWFAITQWAGRVVWGRRPPKTGFGAFKGNGVQVEYLIGEGALNTVPEEQKDSVVVLGGGK